MLGREKNRLKKLRMFFPLHLTLSEREDYAKTKGGGGKDLLGFSWLPDRFDLPFKSKAQALVFKFS